MLPSYAGWEREAGALPATATLRPTRASTRNRHRGFSEAFLVRMLFSCLARLACRPRSCATG
jgi:CRISPR-associated endonuclease/helicase Cas3